MEQGGQLPHFREEGVAGGCELQLALPLRKLWYHTLHLLSLLLLVMVLEQRLVCSGHPIAQCHSVLGSKSGYPGFGLVLQGREAERAWSPHSAQI